MSKHSLKSWTIRFNTSTLLMSYLLPLIRTYLIRVKFGSARHDSIKPGVMSTLVRRCRSTRSPDIIRHSVDASWQIREVRNKFGLLHGHHKLMTDWAINGSNYTVLLLVSMRLQKTLSRSINIRSTPLPLEINFYLESYEALCLKLKTLLEWFAENNESLSKSVQ